MTAPKPRFEMLTVALIGEQLPPGPARDDFEALSDQERMRVDLDNPRWRRIMAALGPDFRLTVPDDFVDAVLPPPRLGGGKDH